MSRFLDLVSQVKPKIKEQNIHEVKTRQDNGESFLLVDVREDREWTAARIPGAIHLGKGVLERDIEEKAPALETPIVLYCGGGQRSALAADALQQMGYSQVASMDGGFKAWKEAGLPVDAGVA